MKAEPRYAIITYGDAMGGGRDDVRWVTEEEARAHVDPSGWSKAVRMLVSDLDETGPLPSARVIVEPIPGASIAIRIREETS